jgi:vacuolar-type H+-ATPase subunit I/STV1
VEEVLRLPAFREFLEIRVVIGEEVVDILGVYEAINFDEVSLIGLISETFSYIRLIVLCFTGCLIKKLCLIFVLACFCLDLECFSSVFILSLEFLAGTLVISLDFSLISSSSLT